MSPPINLEVAAMSNGTETLESAVMKGNPMAAINELVVAVSPAIAMGNLYNTIAWNTSQSMSNAVQAQLMSFSMLQVETAMATRKLLSQT